MSADKPTNFKQLADGSWLERRDDGSYWPTGSKTDRAALAALSDDDIERMAASDPDHPPLDDAFWADFDAPSPSQEAVSIRLDGDVLSFFRKQGEGYQNQINAVLKRYVETQRSKSVAGR